VLVDEAAAVARHPFERIAGQAFVGFSLPDETLKVVVACLSRRRHDVLRRLLEFGPCGRRRAAMALQEVLAIIEESGVDEERRGDQAPVHGIIGDQRRKVLVDGLFSQPRLQIDKMIGQHSGPGHIDLKHVDILRSGCEESEIEGETLFRIRRRRRQPNLVSGPLRPGLGSRLAELRLDPEGGA
jgi:hypothetical protein